MMIEMDINAILSIHLRDKIQKLNFEAIYHLVKNRLLSFTVCEQFVRQYVEENPEYLVYVLE